MGNPKAPLFPLTLHLLSFPTFLSSSNTPFPLSKISLESPPMLCPYNCDVLSLMPSLNHLPFANAIPYCCPIVGVILHVIPH